MQKITLAILFLFSTVISFQQVHAGIRCKNDLIRTGNTTAEVRMALTKCGKVLDKEIVSKETTVEIDSKKTGEKVKKEITTEIWYIRVEERGGMYCYPLTFEEGRLKKIGKWSRCD